jgi:hypothetical protein
MVKYITGTLKLAEGKEFSLTYGYIVLWTGEDYELTIFEDEPVDHTTHEFVFRCIVQDERSVVGIVQGQISRYLSQIAIGAVEYE